MKKLAKKTRIYEFAMQAPHSGSPILMVGGYSSGAGSCRAAVALIPQGGVSKAGSAPHLRGRAVRPAGQV